MRTHGISVYVLVSALAGILARATAAHDHSPQSPASDSAAIIHEYLDRFPQIVYSAHATWRSIYVDNANEAGGDLMLVTMHGTEASTEVLVQGSTRDPDAEMR